MSTDVFGLFKIVVVLCCAIVVLVYGWKILNWVWFRPKKMEKYLRQRGFNGNSYRLLFGDFKEMTRMTREARLKPVNEFSNDIAPRVIPSICDVVSKYGENCFLLFGPRPAIPIFEPDVIREILSKSNIFQKNSSNPLGRLLVQGLVAYETDKWAKHRRLINPAFQLERVKHMVPSFYLSCCDMTSEWDEIITHGGASSAEIDVWPHLQILTSDAISRTSFGGSYEEGKRIFQLQKEQAELVLKAVQSVYIPGFRFLHTKLKRRMKFIAKEVESSILRIISKIMKSIEAGENSGDDLLGILLESNFKEIQQRGNKFGMSLEEVIEECKLFYFAGQETTASLLVWTMILLSKHLDWQNLAREEVLKTFGSEKPDFQELNYLKIVSDNFYLFPCITARKNFISTVNLKILFSSQLAIGWRTTNLISS